MEYFGGSIGSVRLFYTVQPQPSGLCDAIFRALPLIHADETAIVGLPDTVWFPEDGLRCLPEDTLSFLLFPVALPELFDAVITGNDGRVLEIQVKRPDAGSKWIWGAFKLTGGILRELHSLWSESQDRPEYIGTLVNSYLARGGEARAVAAGSSYVDVGTLNGYRSALQMLKDRPLPIPAAGDVQSASHRGGTSL